jgi:glutathione S-transferase
VTIADFAALVSYDYWSNGILDHIPTDVLDAFPAVIAHRKKIAELPSVVAWRSKQAQQKA